MTPQQQAQRLRNQAERAIQTGDHRNGAPGYLEAKARMLEQQGRVSDRKSRHESRGDFKCACGAQAVVSGERALSFMQDFLRLHSECAGNQRKEPAK